MNARWHAALAYALVGEELNLTEPDAPDVGLLREELAARGWSGERIRAHAHGVRPWPHPVPDALRTGLGAAQFAAVLRTARGALDLTVLTVLPPSRRTALTPEEQRLVAEVPPHHGSV